MFITPFFALGQKQILPIEEWVQFLKNNQNIHIAYDPSIDIELPLEERCMDEVDVGSCLEQSTHGVIDLEKIEENHYMLRLIEFQQFIGQVIDEKTKQPLIGAEIFLSETGHYAVSNELGQFSFQLERPTNSIRAVIQYLGFETDTIQLFNNHQNQNIFLRPISKIYASATIVGEKPVLTLSEEKVVVSKEAITNSLSTVQGDALRSLQVLPGVSATQDYSSSLNVRNSAMDQNLILLESIPLYQSGHYYNIFSLISANTINSIDLYKNYFPATYSNVTGGLVTFDAIDPIDHQSEKLDGKAYLSTMLAEGMTSIRFSSKAGVLLSARSTVGDIGRGSLGAFFEDNANLPMMQNIGRGEIFNREMNPTVRFSDYFGVVRLKLGKNWDISLNAIYADDAVKIENSYNIPSRNMQPPIHYDFDSGQSWMSSGVSMNQEWRWGKKMKTQLTCYASIFDRSDLSTTRLQGMGGNSGNLIFSLNDRLEDYSMKISQEIPLSPHVELTAGYQWQVIKSNFDIVRNNMNNLENNSSTQLNSFFTDWKFIPSDNLNIQTGLRLIHQSLIDKFYLSSGLFISNQWSDQWSVKSALGRYIQHTRTFTIVDENNLNKEIWTIANEKTIPIMTSTLAMVGFTHYVSDWSFDVEFYSAWESGVMQEFVTFQNSEPMDQLAAFQPTLFQGEGRRYGADLLIKRQTKTHHSLWAYTLSRSEASFIQYRRGEWIAAASDRRHEINWYNSFTMRNWELSSNLVWATGTPQYREPSQERQPGEQFSIQNERLKNYHRIDLGVTWNIPIKNREWEVKFTVFNVFDYQNIASVRYASIRQIQDRMRPTFFSEEMSLMDRTFNISVGLTL